MKTILIAWIVVFALNRLVHLMADSATPTEMLAAKYTGIAPKRVTIAAILYILSFIIIQVFQILICSQKKCYLRKKFMQFAKSFGLI